MIVDALTQRDEMRPVALKREESPKRIRTVFCDCRKDPGGSQIAAAKCAAIAGIPVQDGASADPKLAKLADA
jgi:hypothetical protein